MSTLINIYDQRLTNSILAGLTNRQLIKDYRLTVIHYNDVMECLNKGWDYYLGEKIHRVLYHAKRDYLNYQKHLVLRGYDINKLKNIPVLAVKTISDLEYAMQTNSELDIDTKNDTIISYDKDDNIVVVLDCAKWHIEKHLNNFEVESGEFTDPNSTTEKLTGSEAVDHLGGLENALKYITKGY